MSESGNTSDPAVRSPTVRSPAVRGGTLARFQRPIVQHALGIVFVLLAIGYRGGQFVQQYRADPTKLGWYDTRYQHAAAHAWLSGLNPYEADAMAKFAPSEFEIVPYPYPPNALPLISPFGLLDYDQSIVVLAVVNALAMFIIAGVLLWMGLDFTRRRGYAWGILASWMGAGFAIFNSVAAVNVWLGQMTSLPAAFAILGIALACRGRVYAGSGIAALGAIKPQLVVFLLPMMCARWPKRATIGVVTVGALTVVPALITLGFPDAITDWLRAVKTRAVMEANAPGSPITFGIRYILFDLGAPITEVAPIGVALLVAAWCVRKRLGDAALMILTLPIAVLFFPAMIYYQIVATPILALLLWQTCGSAGTLAIAAIALTPAIKVLPPVLPVVGHRQQELWLLGVTMATLAIGFMRPAPSEELPAAAPEGGRPIAA